MTDVTSADLSELRASALGAADPLGVAADLADAVAGGRLADPADAAAALTLAAEIAESKTKYEAALRYADQAVAAGGEEDPLTTARAVRARILFRLDRADEAIAELEPLRPALSKYSDAAVHISAALSIGRRNQLAEQWLTEAVKEGLAARTGEPASADDAGQLFFLLQQRHRVRHALGLPHDQHDNLADRLETRLANNAAARPADELLFFSQPEFDKLIAEWPTLAEAYGKTWDEHRAHLETTLVKRGGGTILKATVATLSRHAGSGADPSDPKIRAAYAATLTGSALQISWPPERNGACWCGSGLKYKKCCLPRSRS